MAAGTAAAGSPSPASGKCFISYAREDQASVRRLHDSLHETGHESWVDWESIPPSARWRTEIKMAIEAANSFLFLLSPNSAISEVCRMELSHAVLHNKRIIPVVVKEPEDASVPDALREINWIFLRPSDDFAAGVTSIGTALDTDLDWVKVHTRLLVRAIEWETRGKDKSLLPRGQDLAHANAVLDAPEGKKPAPTELQREFVTAARRYARQSRRLRLTLAVTLICVAAVAAIILYPRLKRQRILAAINNAQGFAEERNGRFKVWFNEDAQPDAVLARLYELPNVDEINLTATRVTDAGFIHLAELPHLRVIEADRVRITRRALAGVAPLRRLEELSLNGNDLRGGLENLRGLSALRSLELSDTRLPPGQLGYLSGCTQLELLDLNSNAIVDDDLKSLTSLTRLTELRISGSKATDAGIQHLAGLPRLQVLVVTGTRVGDAGVQFLRGVHLQEFWAKNTLITDASMASIGAWPLRILSLPGTGVTDAGLVHLRNSMELKELYLGGTSVTDRGLKHIAALPKLQTVYVPYCASVSDAGLLELRGLPQLREVDFEGTRITDRGAAQFRAARPKVKLIR